MLKNEKMPRFPYAEGLISKQLFNKAVAKIKAKFNLDHKRAIELIEDIVKAMITENKPLTDLDHEIAGLSFANWHFLREKSIAEVIDSQNHELSRFH
ncbi:MAG: hypothetical protein WC860_08705 [Candidatus Margulisiibacteriota bacterium]